MKKKLKKVTIDTYDYVTKKYIDVANLWEDYADRAKGKTGTCQHGEKVTLIDLDLSRGGHGYYVKIRKKTGEEGWLIYLLIKEFKGNAEQKISESVQKKNILETIRYSWVVIKIVAYIWAIKQLPKIIQLWRRKFKEKK